MQNWIKKSALSLVSRYCKLMIQTCAYISNCLFFNQKWVAPSRAGADFHLAIQHMKQGKSSAPQTPGRKQSGLKSVPPPKRTSPDFPRDKAWWHFSGLASFCWQCPISTCWIPSTWASRQWIHTCISFLFASACTCLLLYISAAADRPDTRLWRLAPSLYHLPASYSFVGTGVWWYVWGEVVCLLLNSATTRDYKFSWSSMLSAPHPASWKQLWECKWCLDSSREQEIRTGASPWLNIQLKSHLPPITRKSS